VPILYDRGVTVLGGACSRGTRAGAPRSVSAATGAVIVGVGVFVGTWVFVAVAVAVLVGELIMM